MKGDLVKIMKFVLPRNIFSMLFNWKYLFLIKKKYKSNIRREELEDVIFILMIDGMVHHGGLSDRFRGIISLYDFCKFNNVKFKINFIYPFNLTDYLLPNKYNWYINPTLIKYDKNSCPVFIGSYWDDDKEIIQHKKLLSNLLKKKYSQFHIYTNMRSGDKYYSIYFFELFKLSDHLQIKLNKIKTQLGEDYISITFRFQQLLGDFKEGEFKILDEKSKKNILLKSMESIEHIKALLPVHTKILITSDSVTFLNKVKNLEDVFVIEGNLEHMDFSFQSNSFERHVKSFLDYFSIASAKKIYLVVLNDMYKSGFPKRASMLYNKPYEEIFL